MKSYPSQLPIPPVAAQDARAIEILRVWAAQGKQHVSLSTNLWEDPGHWGIMLVDLAKHIANAYNQANGTDKHDVLICLKKSFDAEWVEATDQPTGELLD